MSYDDNRPIVLEGPGWEKLPDGSFRLVVICPTIVHFITLPKALQFGKERILKCDWDSDRKVAYYRAGRIDLS